MRDWRSWDIQQWNNRLLSHYFRLRSGDQGPVVALLVTAGEFAIATEDPEANPDDVRNSFLAAVRSAIRSSRSLLEDASNYEGWPNSPPRHLPRFVAHLLFTCLAASESSDELRDEGSFIARLRELTEQQLPDHSLNFIPKLWKHLAVWLNQRPAEYRPLHLPENPGFARIGYTLQLTFPDRRDQHSLSELLTDAGLSGHEPPVSKVLQLVAAKRSNFRRRFMEAFDDFRELYRAQPGSSALLEHRFWAAVREAALRGRGTVAEMDAQTQLALLADEHGDHIVIFVGLDRSTRVSNFVGCRLPHPSGQWQYALIEEGARECDEDSLIRVGRSVLEGSLRLPYVASFVEQGVLPFAVGAQGVLELAVDDRLPEAEIALVKKELAPDLARIAGPRATRRPSRYEGWVEMRGLKLRRLPSVELDATSLAKVWLLHESLTRPVARLVGGLRLEDGWLGLRETLPRVFAPMATEVSFETEGVRALLERINESEWKFPDQDLSGEIMVSVSFGAQVVRRDFRALVAPVGEAFKVPDGERWIVEGVGGTARWNELSSYSSSGRAADYSIYRDAIYLGTQVGQFVSRGADAAWMADRFGSQWLVQKNGKSPSDCIPTHQVDDAHSRRRWRAIVLKGETFSEPATVEAARLIKRSAPSHHSLPKLECQQTVPPSESSHRLIVHPREEPIERLERVVAIRAAHRADIHWLEWSEFTSRFLKVQKHELSAITRSWAEAGLIEVGSSSRWRRHAVLPRKPTLVGFKVFGHVGAALMGVVLESRRKEVESRAKQMGVLVEVERHPSKWLPPLVKLRAGTSACLERLASVLGLDLQWLDFDFNVERRLLPSAPSHYQRVEAWSRWSLDPKEESVIRFEHHCHRHRPDYWLVSHGERTVWSFDLCVARSWAASLLQLPIVDVASDGALLARHSYLPLPLARTLAILEFTSGGLMDDGSYRYPVRSSCLKQEVLNAVSRIFDPNSLGAPAQMTG